MTTWLTVADAERRFGLSRTTLYRLLSSGTVARVKRTGDAKIYVSAEDLEEATALQPTREVWTNEWRRLAEHRTRAEEALLRHLRHTATKRDQRWLKRHAQLQRRLQESKDRVDAYVKDFGR